MKLNYFLRHYFNKFEESYLWFEISSTSLVQKVFNSDYISWISL